MIDSFPERQREVDLARAHRLLDAERASVLDVPAAVDPALRRGDLPPARVRAARRRACRWPSIWPPAIDPLTPKNMALSPEDAAYIVDQFGIDVERPLLTQVSRFDPWKDPLGVIDAYRAGEAALPGRAARARRLDGARRPGGLGLLQAHRRATRTATPTSTSSRNLNNVGAVEVNAFQVHSRGRDPEVDQGGVRADRDRGAVEGAADRRRPRRRHRHADRGRRDRLARRLRRGVRRGVHRDPARPGRGSRRAR